MRSAITATVILACVGPGLSIAGIAPLGDEFQVNSYTTSSQSYPAVASNGQGGFVVVWSSLGQDGHQAGVFAQQFGSTGSPAGPEFQVNTWTTRSQYRPSVAMNDAGAFVVIWHSYQQDGEHGGVFGQMFDSAGAPVAAEFQVNTYTTDGQYYSAVAMNGAGEFVVVWEDNARQGNYGIFGQRFGAPGLPEGSEFQVTTYTTFSQRKPAVAMNANGGFVVAWEENSDIIGGIFDADGAPVGAEFQVNAATFDQNLRPSVAMNELGEFVASWALYDTSGYGVFRQRFDETGAKVGIQNLVNTYITGSQKKPAISMDASGEALILWESAGQDGDGDGVFARRYNSSGTPIGLEWQVNTRVMGNQSNAKVAADATGQFVVVWQDDNFADGSYSGVFAQRIVTYAPEVTGPAGPVDCSNPALPNTLPTFTWDPEAYDAFKVYMGSSPGFEKGTRVTSGDKAIKADSWTPTKKKWKKACGKAIGQAIDPNSPVMYVAVFGKDTGRSKKDPAKKLLSAVVAMDVEP
jgi:hypothetical protein